MKGNESNIYLVHYIPLFVVFEVMTEPPTSDEKAVLKLLFENKFNIEDFRIYITGSPV